MNLKAHTIGKLQDFKTLLNQFESAGVHDIRFVRKGIEQHITAERGRIRRIIPLKDRLNKKNISKITLCPDCGTPGYGEIDMLEGLTRIGCRKCKKSEVK